MSTAMFFTIYPAIFMAGAIITQVFGNARRPFHEGVLAWVFLPVGLLSCISALFADGYKEFKNDLKVFSATLLNYNIKYVPRKKQESRSINKGFA